MWRTKILVAATVLVVLSNNAVVRAVGRWYKARFLRKEMIPPRCLPNDTSKHREMIFVNVKKFMPRETSPPRRLSTKTTREPRPRRDGHSPLQNYEKLQVVHHQYHPDHHWWWSPHYRRNNLLWLSFRTIKLYHLSRSLLPCLPFLSNS